MSSRNYKKLFVFVIFLVLCLSVSYAANVTDDSTTDKIDTSVTAAETPSIEKESNIAKQTVKKEQNIKKESTRHIPDDPYTFANETLDITGNQYDRQTLTLLDNVNVTSSNHMLLADTSFVVNGNNVNINGLKIQLSNLNYPAIKVTGSNINIIGNNITLYKSEYGETHGILLNNTNNVTISDNSIDGFSYYFGDIRGISINHSSNTAISNNNITITSTSTGKCQALNINDATDTNILNNKIAVYKNDEGETKGISINNSSSLSALNNNVILYAVPQSAGWTYIIETDEWVENMMVSGIKAELSSNITINDNIVTITNSTTWGLVNSSTDAITLKTCNDSQVENNTVTIDGSDYIYAIAVSRFSNNISIYYNTVYLSGKNYVCGIQLASTSNSHIKNNTVYGNCTALSGQCPSYEAFAYGIIDLTGTYGANSSEAIGNIIESNYVELQSTIAYAYELSNTENTQILNNQANVIGNVVMSLGIYNSTNCNISGNTFTVNGSTISLNPHIYEAVYPETTGIKICNNSTGIRVVNQNSINVSDNGLGVTNCFAVIIESNCTESYVIDNSLLSSAGYNVKRGNKAVNDDSERAVVEDNT